MRLHVPKNYLYVLDGGTNRAFGEWILDGFEGRGEQDRHLQSRLHENTAIAVFWQQFQQMVEVVFVGDVRAEGPLEHIKHQILHSIMLDRVHRVQLVVLQQQGHPVLLGETHFPGHAVFLLKKLRIEVLADGLETGTDFILESGGLQDLEVVCDLASSLLLLAFAVLEEDGEVAVGGLQQGSIESVERGGAYLDGVH